MYKGLIHMLRESILILLVLTLIKVIVDLFVGTQ